MWALRAQARLKVLRPFKIPQGTPGLRGFKGGFAPLAGLGAQRPQLYPHPSPPLKGRE